MVKQVKAIKPYAIKKLKFDWHGRPVVQQSFKGKFTKEQIIEYAQKKSNDYQKLGWIGAIQLTVRVFPGPKGWRAEGFTNFGDDVIWPQRTDSDEIEEQPDTFTEFRLYCQRSA